MHPVHPVLTPGKPVKVHHRPRSSATQLTPPPPDAKPPKPPWQRDDPKALTGAVARATKYPTHFAWILRDVLDDYGPVSERSVYRYIAKLVERGQLIKLELGLSFAVYVRPRSRWLKDLDTCREYVMGDADTQPTTKRGPRKVKTIIVDAATLGAGVA